MKRCSHCGTEKPVDQFTRNCRTLDGLCCWCRECRREARRNDEKAATYSRAYRAAHREQYRRWEAAYWAVPENKERKDARRREREAQNREMLNARSRAWAKAHPERVRAASIKRNAARSKEQQAYNKAWRLAHPDLFAEQYRRRRVREIMALGDSDVTAERWAALVAAWDGCCAYCGKHATRMTQDHVRPLSKGGEHMMMNLLPACQSCNSSKNGRTVAEWSRYSRLLVA